MVKFESIEKASVAVGVPDAVTTVAVARLSLKVLEKTRKNEKRTFLCVLFLFFSFPK